MAKKQEYYHCTPHYLHSTIDMGSFFVEIWSNITSFNFQVQHRVQSNYFDQVKVIICQLTNGVEWTLTLNYHSEMEKIPH